MQISTLVDTQGSATELLERADRLYEKGKFDRASHLLARFLNLKGSAWPLREVAFAQHRLGCCLDRLGRATEADWLFFSAARNAPHEFPFPPRFGRAEFESVVVDALDSLPSDFHPFLTQVHVTVKDYPGSEEADPFTLGLYVGIPRTERSHDEKDHLDQVFVYKRNHEIQFPDDRLFEEVRKTVVHEIGHHFGLEEHQMGAYA